LLVGDDLALCYLAKGGEDVVQGHLGDKAAEIPHIQGFCPSRGVSPGPGAGLPTSTAGDYCPRSGGRARRRGRHLLQVP